MDGDDLELFERSLRHATKTSTGGALDAALDELGWRDALTVDRRAAVSILFELQGANNATSSALDEVLATALGAQADPAMGVVLPWVGRTDPPGEIVGERLTIRGVASAGLIERDTALVVARLGDQACGVVVNTTDLALRSVSGLDPLLGMVEAAGDCVRATTRSAPLSAAWEAAVSDGQLAVAHELVGASRTMLQLAREHAVERIQFGRPIASFQAIRHRLADSLVAIEGAAGALEVAWDDPSPLTAAMAKAIAGRAARTVARHCQQVLAGIGFTTEHALHRYVRRVLVLDHLLGTARSLTQQLGEDLLRTRQMPAMLTL